jgi:hypothetical protein
MLRSLVFYLLFFPLFSFAQISIVELEVRHVPIPAIRDTVVDHWNISQPKYETLPDQAKDFLYWVNYSRRNPKRFWDSIVYPTLLVFPSLADREAISLKVDLSQTDPLPMFALSEVLLQTAQLHASDIANNNASPSHVSTNGTDFWERMKRAGIKYCASENFSLCGHGALVAVVLLYLDIGIPNPSHRRSLLNSTFVETGIGSAAYSKEQCFFVQDLSCAQH